MEVVQMCLARRFALVGLTVAAFALGPFATASFAQAASLSGEFFESVVGETSFGDFTCDPDGDTTIPFETTGVALGPYLGTFTESGTVTIGPVTGPLGGAVIDFQATFTITSDIPAGTVTGSKELSPTAPTLPSLAGGFGRCEPDVFVIVTDPNVLYTAQIDAATGTRDDSGTSSFVLRSVPQLPATTTFQEAFNSTEPLPEDCEDDNDEQGDDESCDEDDDEQ